MAQRDQLDRETFSCSICLDLLKDPVTTTCGHSYCMSCIKGFWDGEDQMKIYSCPQCREAFTPRPVLKKNTMLAALVEQLKKTGLQAAPADHFYAGPEDVACDFCTGRKLKAFKSCLVCLASYCENHLQSHYESPTFKKHKLVEPSKKLQENICSHHDEVMKIFCRTDKKSICYLCTMEDHKGHDTVPAAAERTERQRELEVSRLNIQQRIQDREKDVKLLQQEVEAVSRSADKAVEDSEKIFTQLIRLLQKRSSDVKQQIRSQQETEVSGVKELQEKLQQEITELKRKDAELKQLSHTEDHNQFLHNYPSVSQLSEPTDSSSINIRPLRYFEDVTAAVSELRDKLQDILRDEWTNISLAVTQVDVLLPQPPKTRAEFLKYSREITLDPNTVYTWLLLSKGNRKVEYKGPQSYSSHSDRFTNYPQVLSRESLTGRCYWEVEWRGWLTGWSTGVYVAVAYKNTSRAGNESLFGRNDKSWSLHCDTNCYVFYFNNIETPVSGPRSSRVGVYLDHGAGILSFYSVSETMTLLHRVQTTFTQPLYAENILVSQVRLLSPPKLDYYGNQTFSSRLDDRETSSSEPPTLNLPPHCRKSSAEEEEEEEEDVIVVSKPACPPLPSPSSSSSSSSCVEVGVSSLLWRGEREAELLSRLQQEEEDRRLALLLQKELDQEEKQRASTSRSKGSADAYPTTTGQPREEQGRSDPPHPQQTPQICKDQQQQLHISFCVISQSAARLVAVFRGSFITTLRFLWFRCGHVTLKEPVVCSSNQTAVLVGPRRPRGSQTSSWVPDVLVDPRRPGGSQTSPSLMSARQTKPPSSWVPDVLVGPRRPRGSQTSRWIPDVPVGPRRPVFDCGG
ncbi:tripartite motif-containing protein 16-like [Scomber japonicus]|uniref:tripartite motif-containing protein 16-like n=1 Tax=Scomber japonicus TaxID=13676 RepID=UPI002305AF18|nr:tripartite motif-containing protein 16-like [Scomber japonicus]